MCILCGGACGGSVDALMPWLAAGAGIVILKAQAAHGAHKMKNADKTEDEETEVESASEHSPTDS